MAARSRDVRIGSRSGVARATTCRFGRGMPMPRYFFDIIDNGRLTSDDFGMELDSFEEARDQAVAILPDLARDELPDGESHSFACHVRDEDGIVVYRGQLTYQGERPDRASDALEPPDEGFEPR